MIRREVHSQLPKPLEQIIRVAAALARNHHRWLRVGSGCDEGAHGVSQPSLRAEKVLAWRSFGFVVFGRDFWEEVSSRH